MSHKTITNMVSLVATLVLIVLANGCGNSEINPGVTKGQMLNEAYTKYITGDVAGAHDVFERLADCFPGDPAGHCGLGWCAVKYDLEQAVVYFERALTTDPNHADSKIGLAGICEARAKLDDLYRALFLADGVLKMQPNYASETFGVTNNEVHLLIASCYFFLGDLCLAQAQVDIVDPDNFLDPICKNYANNLLVYIEQLRAAE